MDGFRDNLKKMLPAGQSVTVQGSMLSGSLYITVHNGLGAVNKRARFVNKISIHGWRGKFRVNKFRAVTDANYADKEYRQLILDIVSLAWEKSVNG